jgi:hypothetical protein
MWKIAAAFVVFAVLIVWVLSKSGGQVDMSGEKHGTEAASSEPEGPASATLPPVPASK